jgi:hypothetical protein
MGDNENSVEIDDSGFYKDLHNYRHFALVVTDDEIGGIQQIRVDDEKAIEIWELGPRVIEIPSDEKGTVLPGWYLRNGQFVPPEKRND